MNLASNLARSARGGIDSAKRKARETISDVRSPCARCGEKKRTLSAFCASCEEEGTVALDAYRAGVRSALEAVGPSGRLWARAHKDLDDAGVDRHVAVRHTEDLRLEWLRAVVAAGKDQDVTPAQWKDFEDHLEALDLRPEDTAPLVVEYRKAFNLSELRAGGLPKVDVTDLVLPAGEVCFYNEPAKRIQDLPNRVDLEHHGKLVVTDKSLRFVSSTFGGEVPLLGVLGAQRCDDGRILIQATSAGLAGKFELVDVAYFEELIDLALLVYRDGPS